MSMAIAYAIGVPFQFAASEETGPQRDSVTTSDISYAEVGVPITFTLGGYSPLGGGAVNVSREFRLDSPTGQVVTFANPYTPLVADKPRRLYMVETATETGGTADGTKTLTIDLGVIFDRDFINDDMIFPTDTSVDDFINHNMFFLVDPDPPLGRRINNGRINTGRINEGV